MLKDKLPSALSWLASRRLPKAGAGMCGLSVRCWGPGCNPGTDSQYGVKVGGGRAIRTGGLEKIWEAEEGWCWRYLPRVTSACCFASSLPRRLPPTMNSFSSLLPQPGHSAWGPAQYQLDPLQTMSWVNVSLFIYSYQLSSFNLWVLVFCPNNEKNN